MLTLKRISDILLMRFGKKDAKENKCSLKTEQNVNSLIVRKKQFNSN